MRSSINSDELKKARLSKLIYQKELAEMLGISNKQYSLKETGISEFTRREISLLAKYLELSLEDVSIIFLDDFLHLRNN
ncbi:helix-turn-helix transcriptional regulator [Peptostreptococcus equinus]|uniref:Helix-turn-helix transcriptional regulator n=1 Tax=Peptostreptococcus equinus TaxID=3003601 RepID=A0ABY7JTE3_9FIRM|nr:helix-turn-helix transcriptional regulator [Peptostreptococcus sp. CBA3647]WAW15751.1 helix-turn-helix transcriptional regulator [Peptostreptococcus sp. CBA3647]